MVVCENWAERAAVSKKMATSTRQETLKLIEIWGREIIQAQLEGCKRNLSETQNMLEPFPLDCSTRA